MRRRYVLIAVLFALTRRIAMETPNIISMLQTEQIALIAQYNDQTFLEANLKDKKCPIVMDNGDIGKSPYDEYFGAHLIRDPEGIHPPKLMIVKRIAKMFSFYIVPINITTAALQNEKLERRSMYVEEQRWLRESSEGRGYPEKTAKSSMFDTTTSMIYYHFEPHQYGKTIFIEQYYVDQIYGTPRMVFVNRYEKGLATQRFGFIEDANTNKVYYQEYVDGQLVVFEFSIRDYERIITGKMNGIKRFVLQKGEKIHGISSGIVHTTRITEDPAGFRMINTLTTLDRSTEIACEFSSKTNLFPDLNKLIFLKNNDYCMARDGDAYNKERCKEEQNEYLRSIGIGDDINITRWLLVSCTIMMIAIILMCFYIYWLRSTFVSEEERILNNEPETEASMFIAKQRSFPTSFQDPALLDVSVDRWN